MAKKKKGGTGDKKIDLNITVMQKEAVIFLVVEFTVVVVDVGCC